MLLVIFIVSKDLKTILYKDHKMKFVENHFGEPIGRFLRRKRIEDRFSLSELAEYVSVDGISVSVEELIGWLSAAGVPDLEAEVVEDTSALVIQNVPDPEKPSVSAGLKEMGAIQSSAALCTRECRMAAYCKYYERYFGKKCPVDLEEKRNFLMPISAYLDKNYARDEDMKKIYFNIADQAATLHQIMQRKVRRMNLEGIMVDETKVDPTSGKLISYKVVNPLSSSVLADSKQILAMLKELTLTPKSMPSSNKGGGDAASLSKAIDRAKQNSEIDEITVALKKDRYLNRPEITTKEQLLEMIKEKQSFEAALDDIVGGGGRVDVNSENLVPIEAMDGDVVKQEGVGSDLQKDVSIEPLDDNIIEVDKVGKGDASESATNDKDYIPPGILSIIDKVKDRESKRDKDKE